ncbi:MAG: hypothetical protein WCI93_00610 [bacterium]
MKQFPLVKVGSDEELKAFVGAIVENLKVRGIHLRFPNDTQGNPHEPIYSHFLLEVADKPEIKLSILFDKKNLLIMVGVYKIFEVNEKGQKKIETEKILASKFIPIVEFK